MLGEMLPSNCGIPHHCRGLIRLTKWPRHIGSIDHLLLYVYLETTGLSKMAAFSWLLIRCWLLNTASVPGFEA